MDKARPQSGRSIYSFEGGSRLRGRPWDSARATYFSQHANQWFVIFELRLAEALDTAFHSHPQNKP